MIVLEGVTFGSWLDAKGGAPMMKISDLIRDPAEFPRLFHYENTQRELCHWKRASSGHAGTLTSDIQPPELWQIKGFCYCV